MKTKVTMLVVMIVMTLTVSAQTYYGDTYMMRRVNGSMYVCTTNNDMFEVSVMQRPTSVTLPNGRRASVRKAVPTMSGGWCFLTNTGHYGQLYTGGSIDWDRKYSNVVNAKPRQYKGGYDYDFNRGYGYGGGYGSVGYGGGSYGDGDYTSGGIRIGGRDFGVEVAFEKVGNLLTTALGGGVDTKNVSGGVYTERTRIKEEKVNNRSDNSSNRTYSSNNTSSSRNSEVKEVVFGSEEFNNMMSNSSNTVKTQRVEPSKEVKTQKVEAPKEVKTVKKAEKESKGFFVNGEYFEN